jgi:hypothetical protein
MQLVAQSNPLPYPLLVAVVWFAQIAFSQMLKANRGGETVERKTQ